MMSFSRLANVLFIKFPRICAVTTSSNSYKYQPASKFLPRLLISHCPVRLVAKGRLASTMAETSSDLTVDHDVENKMFVINLAGEPEKAVLVYKVIGPDAVNLYHTGVPVSQRGKGIAKVLAKAALDHFASHGTNMKLTCTYLQKYFRENPLPQYKSRVLDL
ncbi:protein NATD1-like [Patiria miniata]|uniref:Protein NATD1 n=1 Tax=Patiria miniata TaxID=46514 RepID=A0A913Z0H1_PATMI|nr:protein NATD1-like [Patiria miniata]